MALKEQISEFIGKNNAKEALKAIEAYIQSSQNHQSQYENYLVELTSKWEKIRVNNNSGLMTNELFDVEKAKWNKKLLEFVDLIEDGNPIPQKRKKKQKSSILLVLLLSILGSGVAFYLLSSTERKPEVNCPQYSNTSSCKLLVADFNYDKDDFANINQLIADEINGNSDLNSLIEAKYTNNLEDLKNGQPMSDDALMDVCSYDYKVFGSLLKSEKGNKLTIRVSPKMNFETRKFERNIGDLTQLVDLIESIDISKLDTSFIVSKVCLACAMKSDDIAAKLESVAKNKMASAKKQYILNSLVTVSLAKKDTVNSLRLLDEIIYAENNDFALGAMEEKSELAQESGDYNQAFLAQTRYITEIENRIKLPSRYRTKSTTKDLKKLQDVMRYKRGTNVIEHYKVLEKDKNIDLENTYDRALHDFKILRKVNFENNVPKLQRHIKELRDLRHINILAEPKLESDLAVIIPVVPPRRIEHRVYGRLISCKGPIALKFKIGTHVVTSNAKGQFDETFKIFESDSLELISMGNWTINKKVVFLEGKSTKLYLKVSPKNKYETIKEHGEVTNGKGQIVKNGSLLIDGKKVKLNSSGTFTYSWKRKYCDRSDHFAQITVKTKDGILRKKILLGNSKPLEIRLEK